MIRRSFMLGLVASPLVVRTPGLLMPVKVQPALGLVRQRAIARIHIEGFTGFRVGQLVSINGGNFVITQVIPPHLSPSRTGLTIGELA